MNTLFFLIGIGTGALIVYGAYKSVLDDYRITISTYAENAKYWQNRYQELSDKK